jgi:hypothetical protein
MVSVGMLVPSAKGSLLPQRIHRMEHEKIGPFGIFLVPIDHNEVGTPDLAAAPRPDAQG